MKNNAGKSKSANHMTLMGGGSKINRLTNFLRGGVSDSFVVDVKGCGIQSGSIEIWGRVTIFGIRHLGTDRHK